jgi:hypothetical protein
MNRQFFIAGVKFRPAAEIREAAKELKVGDFLTLVPEPDNKFDPNAVKLIHVSKVDEEEIYLLGYVPKKFSSEVSGLLSIGAPVECKVVSVNLDKSTWEMFEVAISIPIDEEDPQDDPRDEPMLDEMEGSKY